MTPLPIYQGLFLGRLFDAQVAVPENGPHAGNAVGDDLVMHFPSKGTSPATKGKPGKRRNPERLQTREKRWSRWFTKIKTRKWWS